MRRGGMGREERGWQRKRELGDLLGTSRHCHGLVSPTLVDIPWSPWCVVWKFGKFEPSWVMAHQRHVWCPIDGTFLKYSSCLFLLEADHECCLWMSVGELWRKQSIRSDSGYWGDGREGYRVIQARTAQERRNQVSELPQAGRVLSLSTSRLQNESMTSLSDLPDAMGMIREGRRF